MTTKPTKKNEDTTLPGIPMTTEERLAYVIALEAGLNHALVTIRQYCNDIQSGKYTPEPGEDEDHLARVVSICTLALGGCLNAEIEEEDSGD